METERNFTLKAGVLGVIVTALLIISRFFSNSTVLAVESMNTVLVIVMLIMCMHLVRATSAQYQAHVWDGRDTLVLFLLPCAMLIITGIQLVMEPPAFITSKIFSAALILVSVPVFLCIYFLYISIMMPQNRTLRVFARVMAGVGVAYLVLRMLDAVILPVIADAAGKPIHPNILTVTGWNTHLSFFIGVMSMAGFILLLSENKSKTPAEDKTE